MNPIYSTVSIKTVEKFRLARYVVISPNPESDAMEHMERLTKNSGLLNCPEYKLRKIGWDFPFVSKEQKDLFGLHGYVAAVIIPEDFVPSCDGAELVFQDTDNYAVITVRDPFSAPWEKISGAYQRIYDYTNNHHITARNYDNRICMEEPYVKDGISYLDVYVPIDISDQGNNKVSSLEVTK